MTRISYKSSKNLIPEKYKHLLTLCMLDSFLCFLSSADFFKIFQIIFSGTLSVYQTVWIQVRTDILSVLIWAQTVCKGYQQKTNSPLARKELKTTPYNLRHQKRYWLLIRIQSLPCLKSVAYLDWRYYVDWRFVCSILYIPVNNFSVMLGRVFLGWTNTKQG